MSADACLELARALRAAIRTRDQALEALLADYDSATRPEDRWESAAALMYALRGIDGAYNKRREDALRKFVRRERRTEAG